MKKCVLESLYRINCTFSPWPKCHSCLWVVQTLELLMSDMHLKAGMFQLSCVFLLCLVLNLCFEPGTRKCTFIFHVFMASPSDQLFNLLHKFQHGINLSVEQKLCFLMCKFYSEMLLLKTHYALLPPGAIKSRGAFVMCKMRENIFPPIWIWTNLMVYLNWNEVNFAFSVVP